MSQLNRLIPFCLLTLASCAELALSHSAEQPQTQAETPAYELQNLLLKARKSHYDPLSGQSVVPALKEAFAKAADPLSKENIANVLMMYGQKDEAYWSVLYSSAQEIVNSNAPYPLVFDENGKGVRGQISPEFLEWVKDNNLSKDEALREQLDCPVELSFMAEIGHPRGLPVLRKGLSSPNYVVRAMAARGPALLRDGPSISSIIKAAKTAPTEVQWAIAIALLPFDDSEARAAGEQLIPDKTLLNEYRQNIRAHGARGLFE